MFKKITIAVFNNIIVGNVQSYHIFSMHYLENVCYVSLFFYLIKMRLETNLSNLIILRKIKIIICASNQILSYRINSLIKNVLYLINELS